MDQLVSGINDIANYMVLVGLAIAGISLGVIGIKFFVKGERQLQNFFSEIIALVVGIFVLIAHSSIVQWTTGVFS